MARFFLRGFLAIGPNEEVDTIGTAVAVTHAHCGTAWDEMTDVQYDGYIFTLPDCDFLGVGWKCLNWCKTSPPVMKDHTNPEVCFMCSKDTETWQNVCVGISYTVAHVRSVLQKGKALFLSHYGLLQHTNQVAQVPALAACTCVEPIVLLLDVQIWN